MTNTRILKKSKVISINIELEQYNQILKIARKMGESETRVVSISECIRVALSQVFPYNKQLDLFEKKTPRRILKNGT